MSTIDEVLAAAEVVNAVCVIDGETRIISVPTEYKELGVESDEKVTRIKFRCPKIVGDNVDLTEYNLYINYRNAGNKLNSYLVEDVTVTNDTLSFSWLLSRHVTESPGTISYIVCAKKSDDTGVINEWNTKVATGTVGVGLEATQEIEEQNVDVIEQILKAIVDLENGSGGSGSSVTIDATLSVSGQAADAKATGDAINLLSEEIAAIPSGADGGHYAPAVDAAGNLTWTASKTGMPAVDSANIKGPQGKSSYQYAQEGGYTGTEAQFAAKLAAEKLANPNALTFTGAVTGSYDGSEPVNVEIPSGGSGSNAIELVYKHICDGTYVSVTDDLPLENGKVYLTRFTLPSGSAKLTARCLIGSQGNTYTGAVAACVVDQHTVVSKQVHSLMMKTATEIVGISYFGANLPGSTYNLGQSISDKIGDKIYFYSTASDINLPDGTTVEVYRMN